MLRLFLASCMLSKSRSASPSGLKLDCLLGRLGDLRRASSSDRLTRKTRPALYVPNLCSLTHLRIVCGATDAISAARATLRYSPEPVGLLASSARRANRISSRIASRNSCSLKMLMASVPPSEHGCIRFRRSPRIVGTVAGLVLPSWKARLFPCFVLTKRAFCRQAPCWTC